MASQAEDFNVLSDYILSKIDIHVSGACGPGRTQPIECYYPVHRAYSENISKKHASIDDRLKDFIPGGVPRPVESLAAREGYGLVYDRDIVTTWRLPAILSAYEIFFWEKEFERALGRNTMLVVLEAFYEANPALTGNCNAFELMQRFRGFVEGLGTRMLSVTVSSIVIDMIASFQRMKDGLDTEPFAWEKRNIVRTLHEFVLTRECWQYARNQEPALEVTFGVTGGRRKSNRRQVSEEIILQFDYSWNPPTIGFENLQNVVYESTYFVLKPSISMSRPFSELQHLTIEHYIGPTRSWLQ
ncbi:uncharacterized protein RCC_07444 [Ramularia collo-cygni]|uniref:Uncharacterized protein n=1 Tax=Ramularia collo-cygni TaxID=112498 RepID=A0A2D3V815_9PEZI|nr:uncharacterized protein RCC_07444 [Ramularia collo-cygni]CZT21580.1 uncharacterized protein RCC_07444 [Ramularia collo-cygni]